jgi:tetratricopeptide (TPR) repeat protein
MKKRQYFVALTMIIFSLYACNTPTQKTKTESKVEAEVENQIEVLPLKPQITESVASDKEKELYQTAYNLWYNDKPQEGIDHFTKFIKLYPKSSLADDAQRMIGTAYTNMENYTKAIEEYEKVKINYPDANSTTGALYDLAHLYFYSINNFVKAKYYYEEVTNSATVDDEKIRDIALEQLADWEKQTQRFTGYAERSKEYKNEQQASNPSKHLKVSNKSWERGGFGTVGIHNFSIQNNADISFKDAIIRIDYYSETGTFLGRSVRTVYKQIPSKQSIDIKELNTGFFPTDADRYTINIVTAIQE